MSTNRPTLILASNNKSKLREFQQLLGSRWIIQPQSQLEVTETEEPAKTFAENALLKARHACHHTKLPALADDSGLSVPALGGEPGLKSARYSGGNDEANNSLLLRNMRGLEGADRSAFFVAVLVLMQHAEDPSPIIAEGRWLGEIAMAPRGEGGFGYDPVFVPKGVRMRAAEMSPEEKNHKSHRGLAVRRLLEQLPKL